MKKYELITESPTNSFVLDKEEKIIVALCNTKRPDLQFDKLKELIEKANKYKTTVELLKDVLLSADVSWEDNNEGHDWKECIKAIREFLDL